MAEVTTLVKIKPELDPQIIDFYNQALGLLEYAEGRVIKTAEDLKPATDDLTLIARLKKAMEGRRKDYLQPFQDHIKEVNESYKKLMAPVESADRITRDKILAFNAEQERIRREQERINAERIKLAEDEMKLKGELTESVNLIEVLPVVPTKTQTEMGSAGMRDHWVFEVESFALLPDEYKMVDATKLGKVVRAGLRSIPGCRIFNQPTLAVTANRLDK